MLTNMFRVLLEEDPPLDALRCSEAEEMKLARLKLGGVGVMKVVFSLDFPFEFHSPIKK